MKENLALLRHVKKRDFQELRYKEEVLSNDVTLESLGIVRYVNLSLINFTPSVRSPHHPHATSQICPSKHCNHNISHLAVLALYVGLCSTLTGPYICCSSQCLVDFIISRRYLIIINLHMWHMSNMSHIYIHI